MKKLFLLLLTLTLLASCSKSDNENDPIVLQGTWWEAYDGNTKMDLGFYTDSTCVMKFSIGSTKINADYKCVYKHPSITFKPTSSKFNSMNGIVKSDKEMKISTDKATFTFKR